MGAKRADAGPPAPKSGSAFGRTRPPILSRTTTPDREKAPAKSQNTRGQRLKGPAAP
jgi:hypothetical protein